MIHKVSVYLSMILTRANTVAAVLIVFGLAVVGQAFIVQDFENDKAHFKKRTLALEFARTKDDVDRLVIAPETGQPDWNATESLLRSLRLDSRLVIPAYWFYFVLMHAFLYSHGLFGRKVWLIPLPVVISMTVLADYFENMYAESGLKTHTGIAHIYPAAITKWIGFSIASALLGIGFLRSANRIVVSAGVLNLVAGVLIALLVIMRPEATDVGVGAWGAAIILSALAVRSIVLSNNQ